MDLKIRQVNRKLLRTFERLNYKVHYDDGIQEIIKLNSLVGHVYRLFVQKQLQSASSISGKLEVDSKKEIGPDNEDDDETQYVIDRCCDKVTQLADLFLMLIKILTKKSEGTLKNCLSEMQTTLEEIQQTLLLYQPKQKLTRAKIEQLKSVSLKTCINIVDISPDPQKTYSINPQSSFPSPLQFPSFQNSSNNLQIIEDLRIQVEGLNEALVQNNNHYVFQLKAYTQKLSILQNSLTKLSTQVYHLRKNERLYKDEICQLRNDKLQDQLLIKSMARKLRKFQQTNSFQTRYQDFSSRASNRLPNYMCPRLSRQRMNRNSKSGSRPISIESQKRMRIPSIRSKYRVETLS